MALTGGKSGVGTLAAIPPSFLPTHVAAEVRDFTGDIENFGPLEKEQKKAIRKGLKVMCRECQMGVAAAQLALTDAGLLLAAVRTTPNAVDASSAPITCSRCPRSSAPASTAARDEAGTFDYNRWATEGMPQLSPLWL